MKRIVKENSTEDMIDVFQRKIAELEVSSTISSSTWLDIDGLFGGDGSEQYTDADMKEYWDSEHDSDQVLQGYKTYQEWHDATVANMQPVESSIKISRSNGSAAEMLSAFEDRIAELSGIESTSKITASTHLDAADTSHIYMLMYYLGGTEGMESDEFHCECMFIADDLDDAKRQVADWEGTQSTDYADDGQYYADYYNDYFVDETDGNVYDSVDEWAAAHPDDIYSATKINASLGRGADSYFGETAARMYGQQICNALSGQTISKRRDLAEEPGGLVYEANRLGLEWDRLLEALEGMCADGRAREIDDSTYMIVGGQPHPVRSLFGSNIIASSSAVEVDQDELEELVDKYNASSPVSGDWATETASEQQEIANHFGISLEEAKQVMINQLGFDEESVGDDDAGFVTSACSVTGSTEDAPYYLSNTDEWVHEADLTAQEMEEDNEFSNGWEELASKQVPDADGFMTEYTLYYNSLDGSYACVFGDRDWYRPESGNLDWEGSSESEAWEWFDSYTGFADDEDVYSSCSINATTSIDNIVSWLAEHEQAYADACEHFGTDDLSTVSTDDIIGWISDHTELAEDFVAAFGPITE